MKPSLTRDGIARDLSDAGLRAGDSLLVHSSLSSLGHVEGGVDAVIDAILDVLGAEGTLMTPTFNHWVQTLYDPKTTPGLSGLITETLRRRPAAVRSLHPTHSVAALGKHAREFTEGHERAGGLRRGSPIDKLAKAGGYTLLMGVKHDRNSAIHVGEAYAEPWYLGFPWSANDPETAAILVGSETRTITLPGTQSGCSVAFNALELPLRQAGEVIDLRIGSTPSQLMRTQASIDHTVALIREREDILLCGYSKCFFCSNARRQRAVRSSTGA